MINIAPDAVTPTRILIGCIVGALGPRVARYVKYFCGPSFISFTNFLLTVKYAVYSVFITNLY